jgi:hypothetical protein
MLSDWNSPEGAFSRTNPGTSTKTILCESLKRLCIPLYTHSSSHTWRKLNLGRIRLQLFLWTSLCVGVGVTAGCNNVDVAPEISISPSHVVLLPGQTIQFTQSGLNEQVRWAVDGLEGGSPANGTITSSGAYTAPAASNVAAVQITAYAGPRATVFGVASVSLVSPHNFSPGVVMTTNNSQVARYTFNAPKDSSVQICVWTHKRLRPNHMDSTSPTVGRTRKPTSRRNARE